MGLWIWPVHLTGTSSGNEDWQKEVVNGSQSHVLKGLKEGLAYKVRVVAKSHTNQTVHHSKELLFTVPGEALLGLDPIFLVENPVMHGFLSSCLPFFICVIFILSMSTILSRINLIDMLICTLTCGFPAWFVFLKVIAWC